jgi:lipoprotein-anchoring transpeptidase ErfK/SrfK
MIRPSLVPAVRRAAVTGCLTFGLVGASAAAVAEQAVANSQPGSASAVNSFRSQDRVAAGAVSSEAAPVDAATPAAAPAAEPRPSVSDPLKLVEGAGGPAALHLQVLLDRAGFSPGVVDGVFGGLAAEALTAFQSAHGLEPTGLVDARSWEALGGNEVPGLVETQVTAEEARGRFRKIPGSMMAKARLRALSYSSLAEALAEKYHTTPETLARLNPGVKLAAGAMIRVPNIVPDNMVAPGVPAPPKLAMIDEDPDAESILAEWNEDRRKALVWKDVLKDLNVSAAQPKAAKVVVDKSDKWVRAYDAEDRLIAHFPATLGSHRDPLPIGNWKIANVHPMPTYNYNSNLFWDAKKGQRAVIAPGPNNPVGIAWLGLNKRHLGIHGTPEPHNISFTTSHGCVRLTNWDVARLAQMIEPGTPAILQR